MNICVFISMLLLLLFSGCSSVSKTLESRNPSNFTSGCSHAELKDMRREYQAVRLEREKNEEEVVRATHAGDLKRRRKAIKRRRELRLTLNTLIDYETTCFVQPRAKAQACNDKYPLDKKAATGRLVTINKKINRIDPRYDRFDRLGRLRKEQRGILNSIQRIASARLNCLSKSK